MLWIAVHLPRLALESHPHDTAAPCCVVDGHFVHQANGEAQRLGVQAGQRTASALALVPALQRLERQPRKEAEGVEALALALLRFTPNLVLLPEGVLLDIGASLRLFGGVRRLQRQLLDVASAFASVRLGIGTTPGGAALLARAGGRRRRALQGHTMARWLDRVPVTALPAAAPHRDMLLGLGCRRLQQLRELPRGGLQRRFGVALLRELDQAYGEQPDLRPPYQPPARFASELELMARVASSDALLHASRRLTESLCGWLSARWSAVASFKLVLRHERSRRQPQCDTELELVLAEPTRDPAHLQTVLRERLGRWTLPAPVYHLGLVAEQVVSHAGENASWLHDPARQRTELMRLVDRLQARLGRDKVHRLAIAADFRPERATATVPVYERRPPPVARPPGGLPEPAWLLAAPLRLVERNHAPVYQSPLKLLAGPERIEWGWFDGALVQRDYHVAKNAAHTLLWVYQERGSDEAHWYLHGIFG